MNKLVDASTILAAAAGLWALSLAWLTYVMSVRQHNHDEFVALKSIVEGLRVDLDLMRPWTGDGGPGYSKTLKPDNAPEDWSMPWRLIWKFNFESVSTLSSSPYVYRLGDIVGAFARLAFSISRLFQLYDEYRTYVNNRPTIDGDLVNEQVGMLGRAPNLIFRRVILNFNFEMHVRLIGGQDSDDPACLYKAYQSASAPLSNFSTELKEAQLPSWFLVGHVIGLACAVSGTLLLLTLLRC